MKKTISVLFTAFAALMLAASAAAQTEKQVASIRSQVEEINRSESSYSKTVKDLDNISSAGTEATYYASGDGLKKITAKIRGDSYGATADLYYSGGKLIYAYQKLQRFEAGTEKKPVPKIAKTEESRLYFAEGRMIRYAVKKNQVGRTAAAFAEKENEVADLSDKLIAAFSK
jgi:hypothetical protein